MLAVLIVIVVGFGVDVVHTEVVDSRCQECRISEKNFSVRVCLLREQDKKDE